MNNSQELSTFSHEINNSLTLIYGQIQYIEKTNDILTQNEHWNRMKDDFSSLFDFIHQFLAPEDTTSATIEPLDLINLISELRSSWSYYLHKERIRFFIQADPGTAFYVYGAKSKLFQLFHNLISNAVKAIQQKEEINRSPHITVHLSKEQGHIVLNPAELPEGMLPADYMRICFAMIDTADAIYLLKGWYSSSGASIERNYAMYTGKSILTEGEQT